MGWLGDILKVGAPIAGFALGGPVGAMAGSAIASGISGAQAGSKANKLNEQALAQANQRYAAMQPFRSKLAQLAMKPTAQREDLSALVADPGNPYARVAPRPSLAQAAFSPATAPAAPPKTPGFAGVAERGFGTLLDRARANANGNGKRGNAVTGGLF